MNIRNLLLTTLLALCGYTLSAQVKMDPQTEKCGVKFFTNFESGSLDSVSVKAMMMIHAQMQLA